MQISSTTHSVRNTNKNSMENSKLLTILTEVDEGTKTPFKAHNEILFLFGVSKSLNVKKTI